MSERVDLGWAVYGDNGAKAHRWEYNQRNQLLRSICHAVYRRVESFDVLHIDEIQPKCKICLKRELKS